MSHNIEDLACKKTLSIGNGSVGEDEDEFSQVIFGYRKNINIMVDSLSYQTPKSNINVSTIF
jgi:hypothetical protein